MEFTTTEAFVLALGAMALGIILLIRGGGWTVDSSVYIAGRFGVSPMIVGFTILAFGTSLPELIVSVLANLQGSPGIAIGNVLGSNIANVLLVIGAAAVFATLTTTSKAVIKDLSVMMASTVLLLVFMLMGEIGRLAGFSMVLMLLSYIVLQYIMLGKGEMPQETEEMPSFSNKYAPYLFLLLGLIAIAVGAEMLVRGAKISASVIGVPEAVIALSVIALGTSLPELSTSVIAARKGHSEIVIGNIVGSNVFNILMIIGVTSLVKPMAQGSFAQQLVEFDIWLVLAVSAVFSLLLIFCGRIGRPIGLVFLTGYVAYNIYIYAIYITP